MSEIFKKAEREILSIPENREFIRAVGGER